MGGEQRHIATVAAAADAERRSAGAVHVVWHCRLAWCRASVVVRSTVTASLQAACLQILLCCLTGVLPCNDRSNAHGTWANLKHGEAAKGLEERETASTQRSKEAGVSDAACQPPGRLLPISSTPDAGCADNQRAPSHGSHPAALRSFCVRICSASGEGGCSAAAACCSAADRYSRCRPSDTSAWLPLNAAAT